MSERKCPECGKPRPDTGGAFCRPGCEFWYRHGRSVEFEADVALALAAIRVAT